VARMSVSTFHQHFRTLTQMSSLQYQKRVRLHMARVRMTEGMDAASAAFEFGYDSASQFNREYRRLFGLPPMRDIKARQLVEGEQDHREVHSLTPFLLARQFRTVHRD